MKKNLSRLFLFCLTIVGLLNPTLSFADSHHQHSESKDQDPLVGPWTFNFELAGTTIYGVIIFHGDGTFIFHDSSELTQSIPGLSPQGDFFTFSAGVWEKLRKRHYQGISTCVILARGLQCTGDNTPPGCLSFPAVPFARTKNFIRDIVIQKNLQTATATVIVTFHPLDDLGLTQPLIDPSTGQPIPNAIGTVLMQKLTLDQGL